MALGEKRIDKYLEYSLTETAKLNWAELRQMRHSKLNKQSSLLGDSTMVIRVSWELPYIIYGRAVGCLQLNRPTVHWLGTLWEQEPERRELKMALFPLQESHFHLNEGWSPKRVVSKPSVFEMCWLRSKSGCIVCSKAIDTHTHTHTHTFSALCSPLSLYLWLGYLSSFSNCT